MIPACGTTKCASEEHILGPQIPLAREGFGSIVLDGQPLGGLYLFRPLGVSLCNKLMCELQFGRKAFEEYVALHGRASKRQDLLTKILSPPKDGFTPLSDRDTYVKIGNLCFAGEGTTSASLTYLFWELTRHPEWQTRIREEASKNAGEMQTHQSATPILDAVINEALRLHSAAPASLLRVVPAGGAELAGSMLPSGVGP